MPRKYKTQRYKDLTVSNVSDDSDDDSTTIEEAEGRKQMVYYFDTTNIKSPEGKPLVRQAEAARAGLAKMFGDVEISTDPNWEGDTEIESEDENAEKERVALKNAAEERIKVMKDDQTKDIVVLGSGDSAVQVDPVVSKMLLGMTPQQREEAGLLIHDSASQMRNAVEQIVPTVSDPPVKLFVKSEGKDIPLTSRNVLDLKENGKFVDPSFFDMVAWRVAQDPNTSFEDKKATYQWCMVIKGMFILRIDLLDQTETLIKTETKTILGYQDRTIVHVSQMFSRYMQMCDRQKAEEMQRITGIQGGLEGFSKFVTDGIIALNNQNADTNKRIISLQGSVQEIEQNNLSRQESLYDGLRKSFAAVMNQLNNQSRDLTATKEEVTSLKKELEVIRNQGGTLSQEQKEHMGTLITKLTDMLGVMAEIRHEKIEADTLRQELLDALSSIGTLTEAVEGIKVKTLYERKLLAGSSDVLQKLSVVVPEVKAAADSLQETAANYGKAIFENQQITKVQFDVLQSISKSLVSVENSMGDSQKIQSDRQQELLKALQSAASGKRLEDVMAALKDISDRQSKPPFNIQDVTNMIIEGVVARLKGAAGGGAPPPLPPGGDPLPVVFDADAPSFVPSSRQVVVSNRRGKVARAAKKTYDASKRILKWKKRVSLVGKFSSRLLGRERTNTLIRGLLGGGAMFGYMMGPRLATAVVGAATGIGTLVSIANSILPAVKTISGYLAQYLAKYDERSSETNRLLGRQTQLLEEAIARLTELKGAGDGDRFNRAPAILRDLLSKIGEFKPIVVSPVMNYGRLEMMTPEERFRSVISLAERSKPISLRTHGMVEIKKNITDPALDHAVDYKRATVKRRATRVKKIENRRTNDPLNKFFQGNW